MIKSSTCPFPLSLSHRPRYKNDSHHRDLRAHARPCTRIKFFVVLRFSTLLLPIRQSVFTSRRLTFEIPLRHFHPSLRCRRQSFPLCFVFYLIAVCGWHEQSAVDSRVTQEMGHSVTGLKMKCGSRHVIDTSVTLRQGGKVQIANEMEWIGNHSVRRWGLGWWNRHGHGHGTELNGGKGWLHLHRISGFRRFDIHYDRYVPRFIETNFFCEYVRISICFEFGSDVPTLLLLESAVFCNGWGMLSCQGEKGGREWGGCGRGDGEVKMRKTMV